MPWRQNAPTPTPTVAQPVPDTEALRRTALGASWQRDRGVARRRLAWRWLLWALRRWLLPLALLLTTALALWQWLAATPPMTPTAVPTAPSTRPVASTTPPDPLQLKLEGQWADAEAAATAPAKPPDAGTPLTPDLKPDHRLHIQEP